MIRLKITDTGPSTQLGGDSSRETEERLPDTARPPLTERLVAVAALHPNDQQGLCYLRLYLLWSPQHLLEVLTNTVKVLRTLFLITRNWTVSLSWLKLKTTMLGDITQNILLNLLTVGILL